MTVLNDLKQCIKHEWTLNEGSPASERRPSGLAEVLVFPAHHRGTSLRNGTMVWSSK